MDEFNAIYKVLENKTILSNSVIAIEYKIPNSNKRIDFIVSDEDNQGRESAIIIELKQWQMLIKERMHDILIQNNYVHTDENLYRF